MTADIVLAFGTFCLGCVSGVLGYRFRKRPKYGPLRVAVAAVCEKLEDPACVWTVKSVSKKDKEYTYRLELPNEDYRDDFEFKRAQIRKKIVDLGGQYPSLKEKYLEEYEALSMPAKLCVGYPPNLCAEPVQGMAGDLFSEAELRMLAMSSAVAMRHDLLRKTGHYPPAHLCNVLDESKKEHVE